MNKNGVIAVVVVVSAIVLLGLWAMRSAQTVPGADCSQPPSAPAGVTHTVARDLVTINWNAPPAGETISTYVIEAASQRGVNPTAFFAPGNATQFQRQAPPATYYVRVFARNACGTSPPAPEFTITVAAP